ncbi:tlde1 domain-containing protein [Methylobacterium phyllosphaerae]
MAVESVSPDGLTIRTARRAWVAPFMVMSGAIGLAAVGAVTLNRIPSPGTVVARPDMPAPAPIAEVPAEAPATEASATGIPDREPAPEVIGGSLSRWAWNQIEPPALTSEAAPEANSEPGAQIAEPPRATMVVPLPMPRPPEFRNSAGAGLARRSERRMARREAPPAAQSLPKPDERSFLEKLFGIEHAPALAYTALESRPADVAPQRRISPPLAPAREPSATAGIAVYNIAAKSVTLPNGERLEAHSGLGEGLDDPRLVNVRMRGPTPPGTYDLTEREQPFHGVRAIRLTPVGGNEAVYGRVGLLAHTYMLGPRGDSNGCVSFRDYDRFLQAFLRGEVQRLVVVSGTQDALPSLAAGTVTTRMARNGG